MRKKFMEKNGYGLVFFRANIHLRKKKNSFKVSKFPQPKT